MCEFASALVSRTGEVYFHQLIDSHEHLVDLFGFDDSTNLQKFIRIEFLPGEDICDVAAYTLKVDERETPGWFDDEMRERTIKAMESKIECMIIPNDRKIIVGGRCILNGEVKIGRLIHCVVHHAGYSKIAYAGYSKIGKK